LVSVILPFTVWDNVRLAGMGVAPLIAREIWRICGLIRESGISSVIVDKNWKHVTQISTRNVILVKGAVVFGGSSAELIAKLELLEQYLGV
jgi:branched-chain amino acid transport system ATP-binding protein